MAIVFGSYIKSADQLIFPNGRLVRQYLDGKIDENEKDAAISRLIEESEKWVNNHLVGRTVVPATASLSQCRQIALEYARFLVLRDNYLFQGAEDEKAKCELYLDEAKRLLEIIEFAATASSPEKYIGNVGDGTISAITVYNNYTITEDWILQCLGNHYWSVQGSKSGYIVDYDSNRNLGFYPVQSDGDMVNDEQRRIRFKITEGTIPFAVYDEIRFTTYAASYGGDSIETGARVKLNY